MFIEIEENAKSLLDDAAKRKGMDVYMLVTCLLNDAASEEYAKQQCEDWRTQND